MKKLSLMTDEELAVEYVNGNDKAFDMILERTQTGIFSYIMFIVRNEEFANDIFQETYLKAIMKLQKRQYAPSGKLNAWLIRIAHNAIMDWYRRQKTRSIVDSQDNMDIVMISDNQQQETCKEDVMANMQTLKDVKCLISFLPKPQQDVVIMRYYQNYSFKEIAEMTGVSINTSLGRMRYALINMRRLAKQHKMNLQLI